jgi:DNA-binding MarR family transcriptional regulator
MRRTGQKQVRDMRDGNWFWIHNLVLSKYARELGPSGFLVYSALALFANSRTQICFPTQKALAKITGLSRRTVIRKVKLLEKLGLIKVERGKRGCVYYLLDPDVTEKSQTCDLHVTCKVKECHTNNNYLTKIYNNNIADKKIFRFIASKKRFEPNTREELLARDIAQALEDEKNLPLYLSYAKKYPETFLRGTLADVMEKPSEKLKKGRAALFNYLVQKHAKEKNPGH